MKLVGTQQSNTLNRGVTSLDGMHRSEISARTAGSPDRAAELAEAFAEAYTRSVNHRGATALDRQELHFLTELVGQGTRVGVSSNYWSGERVVEALERVAQLQQRKTRRPSQLKTLLARAKDSNHQQWERVCDVQNAREDYHIFGIKRSQPSAGSAYSAYYDSGYEPSQRIRTPVVYTTPGGTRWERW